MKIKWETKNIELDYNINDLINNNYTINCKRENGNNNNDLYNSMPIIKNEILLVLFDNGFTSNISYGS